MPLSYAAITDVWAPRSHSAVMGAREMKKQRETFDGTDPVQLDALRVNLQMLYQAGGPEAVVGLLPRQMAHMVKEPTDALDKVILLILGGFITLVLLDMRSNMLHQAAAVAIPAL